MIIYNQIINDLLIKTCKFLIVEPSRIKCFDEFGGEYQKNFRIEINSSAMSNLLKLQNEISTSQDIRNNWQMLQMPFCF